MSDGIMVGSNIPVQGEKAGHLGKIGKATFADNVIVLQMDEDWTEIVTDLVRDGAQIFEVVIDVKFLAARKKEA